MSQPTPDFAVGEKAAQARTRQAEADLSRRLREGRRQRTINGLYDPIRDIVMAADAVTNAWSALISTGNPALRGERADRLDASIARLTGRVETYLSEVDL